LEAAVSRRPTVRASFGIVPAKRAMG
jgi:hypothetical protein